MALTTQRPFLKAMKFRDSIFFGQKLHTHILYFSQKTKPDTVDDTTQHLFKKQPLIIRPQPLWFIQDDNWQALYK